MTDDPQSRSREPARKRGTWVWLLLAAGFVTAAVWQWPRVVATYHAAFSPDPGPPAEPVKAPVQVAEAERRDFPLYLFGIGAAQPWNSVTIRSRVEGQIDKVAFEEGQMVHEGDLLVQIDPRPFQAALDQAIAKKALDEALLANTKRDLERYAKVGRLAVTEQQIDTQRALVKQQEAQIQGDQGAIDNARVQLSYTTIKAPMSGRLGFRNVDVGNIVRAGDTTGITRIAQIQPIAVIFTAPEEQLPRLTASLRHGPLAMTALTSDGKAVLGQGTVALIDNAVDPATGSIRLKGKFDNPDNALWPGLTVSTKLQVHTLPQVVIVPDLAVQRGPDGLFAFVVKADDTVEKRPLRVGEIQGGFAVVEAGLEPGERVVTSGHYRLQPGAAVEVQKSSEPGNIAGDLVKKVSGPRLE